MEKINEECSPLLKKEQPVEEKLSVVLEKAKQALKEEKLTDSLNALKNQNSDIQNVINDQRMERIAQLNNRYMGSRYETEKYFCKFDFLQTIRSIYLFNKSIYAESKNIEFIFSRVGDNLRIQMNEYGEKTKKIEKCISYDIKFSFEDEYDFRAYITYAAEFPEYSYNFYIKKVYGAVSLLGEMRYYISELLDKS